MIVEPTKPKPRRRMSALMRSESSVRVAGRSPWARRFRTGRPATDCQRQASKLPNSACTCKKARALPTADAILPRWRMMAGLTSSASIRAVSKPATTLGSKSSNAAR